MCEPGLPKQERRTAGASSGISQDMVGSTSVREEHEHPATGVPALIDRTGATVYIPWAREMMEDIVKEGPTFSDVVSLMDANVSIG
jgi:hypothetical protein